MKKMIALFVAALMMFTLAMPAIAADADAEQRVELVACLGDINDDGYVAVGDARLALRCAVGLEPDLSELQLHWADVNGNGVVEVADARSILRIAVSLDEQIEHPDVVPGKTEATWLAIGEEGNVCSECERFVGETVVTEAKLDQVVNAANAWAEKAGVATLVKGEADVENAVASVIVDVDGIWDVEGALDTAAFDGFMTAFGAAVKEYVGADTVKIIDETVYADEMFQNTAIKNVLFEVGAGLFYKLANLDESLVFGTYAVEIGEETFDLIVKIDGSEENIAKVKGFAQTISEHIAASVVDGDLVIDVKAPDALVDYITELKPEDTESALNAKTIGEGLSLAAALDVDNAFGSNQSAVNRLCAVLNSLDGFINKVLAKVTVAEVTTAGGEKVDLLSGNGFNPEDYRTDEEDSAMKLLVNGVAGAMSDELLALTVGDFANEDGYYTVQVDIAVDMSNVGDMVNSTITETIYLNIHVFDDVDLG